MDWTPCKRRGQGGSIMVTERFPLVGDQTFKHRTQIIHDAVDTIFIHCKYPVHYCIYPSTWTQTIISMISWELPPNFSFPSKYEHLWVRSQLVTGVCDCGGLSDLFAPYLIIITLSPSGWWSWALLLRCQTLHISQKFCGFFWKASYHFVISCHTVGSLLKCSCFCFVSWACKTIQCRGFKSCTLVSKCTAFFGNTYCLSNLCELAPVHWIGHSDGGF